MKLTALQYGTTRITEAMAFPGGRKDTAIPIALLFFLIETQDRRILVDTGCDTMPGFPLYSHEKPVLTLARLGLTPGDITDVILTHPHGDHASCAHYYPHARFWVQEEALGAMAKYLPDNANVTAFADSATPAPGITLRHIGGHTRGSSIVELEDGRVLCGDECYTQENFIRCIPTGASTYPEQSAAFVREYQGRNTILFHDPRLVGAIGTKIL